MRKERKDEMERYGIDRSLEPKNVLPTSAWRLDNSRKIRSNEMRVSIRKIHVEITSFKQISQEARHHDKTIKEKIIDIVQRRGKLHNPSTDTGGLLYGVVEEIGPGYANEKGLRVGDEILCNTSLAGVPLYINNITGINKAYGQLEAEGYAIIYEGIPVVRKPEDVPLDLLLYAFNESGTLFRVSRNVKENNSFLVVGNNIITNLLFGYVIRKKAGPEAEIMCMFHKKTELMMVGDSIDKLLTEVFNEVQFVDILRPVDCVEKYQLENRFDMTINCADIQGAETINILSTKPDGTVIFANLINNYNIALYITESISKHLNLKCADGYEDSYEDFDIEIVREIAPYIEGATITNAKEEGGASSEKLGAYVKKGAFVQGVAEDFICESHAMKGVLDEIMKVSKYDCNVLLTGETGVGKDRIASIIQRNSTRKMQPFLKINCAAIAPNLIESELFGYEKGAFTGAKATGKAGYFESADNGILFLDEVGELPLEVQAKLLRVTQDGVFYKVGATDPIKTNVRIISATNRNLLEMIENKEFRLDLYYRLNGFSIKVPSLKERKDEIPALIEHFIGKFNEKYGGDKTMDEEALSYLTDHNWPGNIRELENTTQRILIASEGDSVTLMDVFKCTHDSTFAEMNYDEEAEVERIASGQVSLDTLVNSFEKNLLRQACMKYGSTRKTAEAIGISQTQLVRKKKKYGI